MSRHTLVLQPPRAVLVNGSTILELLSEQQLEQTTGIGKSGISRWYRAGMAQIRSLGSRVGIRRSNRLNRITVILERSAFANSPYAGAVDGTEWADDAVQDLSEILEEIAKSIVPRFKSYGQIPERVALISLPGEYGSEWRSFYAIWTKNGRVVAYYAVGLGAQFLTWAATFHPSLYEVCLRNADEYAVIIPRVARMSIELRQVLSDVRRKTWTFVP